MKSRDVGEVVVFSEVGVVDKVSSDLRFPLNMLLEFL